MAFERKYIEGYTESKEQYSKSFWCTDDNRKDIFELGCRLRQPKLSAIINQAFKLAIAKLRAEEELCEIMYATGRQNKRSGLDDIDLIKIELNKKLSKTQR